LSILFFSKSYHASVFFLDDSVGEQIEVSCRIWCLHGEDDCIMFVFALILEVQLVVFVTFLGLSVYYTLTEFYVLSA